MKYFKLLWLLSLAAESIALPSSVARSAPTRLNVEADGSFGQHRHGGDAANHHGELGNDASFLQDEDKLSFSVTQDTLREAQLAVKQEAESGAQRLKTVWGGSNEVDASKLARMFYNTYRYSIDHAIKLFDDDNTIFVSTGDIPQMWLRDSAFQLHAYLGLAAKSKDGSAIRRVMESAMARQRRFILDDPYASAFFQTSGAGKEEGPNKDECPPTKDCPSCRCETCAPECGKFTYQKDFELDSLLFPLLLHYDYWTRTGSTSHLNSELISVMQQVIKVVKTEQRHQTHSKYVYKPVLGSFAQDIGLVWSYALPSDDQAGAMYNIPENIMAANVLLKASQMAEGPLHQPALANEMKALSAQIDAAVKKHGIVKNSAGEDIYAFAVDGYGKHVSMDDANLPNLLWLSYLSDEIHSPMPGNALYDKTRQFILSSANSNYFGNGKVRGLGSQHQSHGLTRFGNSCNNACIWHLGLSMQGLTSSIHDEKVKVMNEILTTDADKELLHEGFEADEPSNYNRDEFGWANSLFAEWVLRDWTSAM